MVGQSKREYPEAVMRIPARWVLSLLGAGLAIGMLAAVPVQAQSSSQSKSSSQAKPAESGPSHWGWFVPKPPKKPTAKSPAKAGHPGAQAGAAPGQAGKKPEPLKKSVSVGGSTPGGRPPVTTTVTQTGTPGGPGTRTEQISIPGINGGSQSLVDQRTQTIKVNDHTTRTITKIYSQGPNSDHELIGVQKTDTTDLGGGKSRAVSTYSKIDADGRFRVERREVSNTNPTGPHSSVTHTTVFRAVTSGQMEPSQKIVQTNRSGKNTDHMVRTVLTPDVNGGWVTNKKTVTVVDKQGKGKQTEEKTLYAPDANGNLTVAKRVVTRDWKAKDGKDHQEVSTYEATQGGTLTRQGAGLTLMQRVNTVKTTKTDGTVHTRQQTEERSLVSPSEGLKVTGAVISVSKPTNGEMKTHTTVLNDDGNGYLRQVSVFSGQQPKPEPAAGAKPSNGKKQGTKSGTGKTETNKNHQNQKQ
jgi:hypothetical protein